MWLLLVAMLVGICAGIITGITPGVHINLVAAILLGLSPLLAQYVPLITVGVLIVSMSITHNFLDMIPSVFLGAPDEATALGVLPGHRYLINGQGLMAIKLTIFGGIVGSLIVLALFLPIIWLIKLSANVTKGYLFWILLSFVVFTILKDQKKILAMMIFLISGVVGYLALQLPLDEPLLPLLSGIFGVATLVYSIKEKNKIPEQKDLDYTDFREGKLFLGSFLGAVGAFLTALFPGISAAMAAALVSRTKKLGDHGFMILLGSLGSASFILSLAAWLAIEKARNGAMAVVVELAQVHTREALILIAAMLVATGLASVLTLWMGRSAAKWLPKIPYTQTCVGVICLVMLIVFLRTGWLGLLVLMTSTAVGILPATLKTARAQAMGCLLLPLLVMLW